MDGSARFVVVWGVREGRLNDGEFGGGRARVRGMTGRKTKAARREVIVGGFFGMAF